MVKVESVVVNRALFNAQHGALGAYFSFTCGMAGAPGGLGVELGQPADQQVFVGWKDGARASTGSLWALPWFAERGERGERGGRGGGADNFLGEQAGPVEQQVPSDIRVVDPASIDRQYGLASDTWRTGPLGFAIYTPLSALPDPATASPNSIRDALLPAVTASLTLDNRDSTSTRTAFFALKFAQPGGRPLNDWSRNGATRRGFAWRRELGVAGQLADTTDDATAVSIDGASLVNIFRWSVDEGLRDTLNPVHRLGSCPGLAFEVPAGKRYSLTLALGVYREGVVTTGLEGRYLYTRHYGDLEAGLDAALDRAEALKRSAHTQDRQLQDAPISADQRFMIAHATRSYVANTQLLEVGGEPFWIVNEGEFRMMNTLDLSVDQMFWELDRNPWVVRNLLDRFIRHYSFHDTVCDSTGRTAPGGVSFCHDMGVNNQFSPAGTSSYEMAGLTGCFSHMTMEQLCNWVLLAASYAAKTGDTGWLNQQRPILDACATSLRNRCNEHGVMVRDSERCAGGAEITTYDSLDESLGQARANTYILVKTWAAWLGLDQMRAQMGLGPSPLSQAQAIAAFLPSCVDEAGELPAVLEPDSPGFASRILPAVEALVYPAWWRRQPSLNEAQRRTLDAALAGPMIDALRGHARSLLLSPGTRNVFEDGGLKLSSTSNNSWMSKIAIVMHVCREVLGMRNDPRIQARFARADEAHVTWQVAGSAYWACSDQIISGVAKASRYYPRIVTAALWLDEQTPAPDAALADVLGENAAVYLVPAGQ